MKPDEAFKILGVTARTPAPIVRQFYRRLVKQWHPDQFAAQPRLQAEAEQRLKIFNRAYAVVQAHLKTNPPTAVDAPQQQPADAKDKRSVYTQRFVRRQPPIVDPGRITVTPMTPPLRPNTCFHRVLSAAGVRNKAFKQPADITSTQVPLKQKRRYYRKRSSTMSGIEAISPISPIRPVRPVEPIGGSDD